LFDDGEAFTDLAEAFADEDEDGIHTPGEFFVDFGTPNGVRDPADGMYNGVLCAPTATNCAAERSVTVFQEATILMSGSFAFGDVLFDVVAAPVPGGTIIDADTSPVFQIAVQDTNGNPLPQASSETTGRPSWNDGNSKTSEQVIKRGTSSRMPSSVTRAPNPNSEIWRNRNVLVTGHTGFKGSWLSVWLNQLGANVAGYSLPPPTTPAMYDQLSLDDTLDSTIGDVRDLDKLTDVVRATRASVVFHLAAQPIVRASYYDPLETYTTNVIGTANLLEAARSSEDLDAIVVVSSDKCYLNPDNGRHHVEQDPMGGHDPYSSSKGCVELVAAAYRSSFFVTDGGSVRPVRMATARAGNVIGGGDWAKDRLIPDVVRARSTDRPVEIRNPQAVRPWQHVLEPLCGYLTLAEQLVSGGADFSEAWNFGPLESGASARTIAAAGGSGASSSARNRCSIACSAETSCAWRRASASAFAASAPRRPFNASSR